MKKNIHLLILSLLLMGGCSSNNRNYSNNENIERASVQENKSFSRKDLQADEDEIIFLTDDKGNETTYKILLTIDGQKEFGKTYALIYPADVSDEEEIDLEAYSYTENNQGMTGEFHAVETDDEWAFIEEAFAEFTD